MSSLLAAFSEALYCYKHTLFTTRGAVLHKGLKDQIHSEMLYLSPFFLDGKTKEDYIYQCYF